MKRRNYSLLRVFTVIIICYDCSLIEKLESDITLKDSTIAILVNEKSQLMKMMQSEEALVISDSLLSFPSLHDLLLVTCVCFYLF